MTRPSLRDLQDAYDPASRLHDKGMDFLGYYIFRPISFPLTIPFLRLGLSADQVTYIRIASVALALLLLLPGGYVTGVIAGFLLFAHVFLDLIDGNIARLQGTSAFGGYIDEITDIFLKVLTPIAVAVGLYNRPDAGLAWLDLGWTPEAILVVGSVTAVASCAKAYIRSELSVWRGKVAGAASEEPSGGSDAIHAALAQPPKIGIAYLYRTGVSLLIPMIPVFAILDALSIYLALIFLSRTLTLPLDLASAVRQARRDLT